ncbi:MAG: 30S ribosome-binding factor RbfA [Dehalococcoidia bacterium]|tara:strand:- start:1220 stop:1564 length:345 start_codon:yes stop_codon:yes gene_type:complete
MTIRTERINETLRTEISQLLLKDINDPRLDGIITITEVSVSPDLKNAQVFISVLGTKQQQDEALEGMKSAASFLRRSLRNRIMLRNTPFLSFKLDNSAEIGDNLLKLISKANQD